MEPTGRALNMARGRKKTPPQLCAIRTCTKFQTALGLCAAHYRAHSRGTPLSRMTAVRPPPLQDGVPVGTTVAKKTHQKLVKALPGRATSVFLLTRQILDEWEPPPLD